jgi:hypothetical protein
LDCSHIIPNCLSAKGENILTVGEHGQIQPRTDVVIFLNIFAEKFSEKIGVFDSKQSQILKKTILTLVFKKNANFFAKNLEKIEENCDHNIDPKNLTE